MREKFAVDKSASQACKYRCKTKSFKVSKAWMKKQAHKAVRRVYKNIDEDSVFSFQRLSSQDIV